MESSPYPPPPLPPAPQSTYLVALTFQQSAVDFKTPTVPANLSVVSSYPQPPSEDSQSPKEWVFPNTGSGAVVATDLNARGHLDTRLFYVGIILGIAGGAAIGAVQAFFMWRERPDANLEYIKDAVDHLLKTERNLSPATEAIPRIEQKIYPDSDRPENAASKFGALPKIILGGFLLTVIWKVILRRFGRLSPKSRRLRGLARRYCKASAHAATLPGTAVAIH